MSAAAAAVVAGSVMSSAADIYMAERNNKIKVDLANTAHQREVRDLRRAGLNPILSATGGSGAAVPNLSVPDVENPAPAAVEAHFSAKRLDLETAMNKASINKLTADAGASVQAVEESKERIKLMQQQAAQAAASARQMDRSKPVDQLINEAIQPVLGVVRELGLMVKGRTSKPPDEMVKDAMSTLGFDVTRPGLVDGVVKRIESFMGWDKAERALKARGLEKLEIDVQNTAGKWRRESVYDRAPGEQYGGPNGARR